MAYTEEILINTWGQAYRTLYHFDAGSRVIIKRHRLGVSRYTPDWANNQHGLIIRNNPMSVTVRVDNETTTRVDPIDVIPE